MNFERNIQSKLEKAIGRSPVVLLLGARQTGKTTVMRALAKDQKYHYISLDDIRIMAAAKEDPMGFIQRLPKPVIIDEIQRVPDLFLSIKHFIDTPGQRINGTFALTGSANPFFIPHVGDSLAGRIEILTLYPLSQGELNNSFEIFIDTIWQENNLPHIIFKPYSREELFKIILTGGYPTVQNKSWEDIDSWFENYLTTISQKDILDLSRLEDTTVIPLLLSAFCARSGQLLNITELGTKTKIPASSVSRYMNLLEALFIIYMLEAWNSNVSKRALKSPKAYLIDSGLLSYLQMETLEKVLKNPLTMGHILENFVVSELKKQLTWNQTRANLYHFRTTSQVEVDIVLERADGKIIGIEIKGNSQVSTHDTKGLEYLQKETGANWHRGIVLYTGDQEIPLKPTITALPISSLWSYIKQT